MATAFASIGARISSAVDETSRWIKETHGHGEAIGLTVACLMFMAAVSWWEKNDEAKTKAETEKTDGSGAGDDADASKAERPSEADGESKSQDGKGGNPLRNVFSVKQKPVYTGNGSSGKKKSSEKPFESSYYFAHNKHSTGGGYKDGLRAEDYVMNGPRLLSKGGVRVADEPQIDAAETNDTDECIPPEKSDAGERSKPKSPAFSPITKYMWDDDGSSAVAKIHIDSLPTSSTSTMKWESAGISKENVEARLIGENDEGLSVTVAAPGGKIYRLHVPRMYGEAASVRCIAKKHKLLVKITKKERHKRYSDRHSADDGLWTSATKMVGRFLGGEEEEKEEFASVAWPRLGAASSGGLGGGTADIDEKLFKEMDTKGGGGGLFNM